MELAYSGWNVPVAAAGLAVVHTVLGPDHFLPFGVLARARGWSLRRTLAVAAACGMGHVLSSLLLGLALISLGIAGTRMTSIEDGRGDLAAWGLIVFGGLYALWGVRRALRHHRAHKHRPVGADTTFWTLFLIFVLGPCEPLVPLFFLPASEGRWDVAATAGFVFTLATLVTMLALTFGAWMGFGRLPLGKLEPWAHSLAGTILAGAGLAVRFLGL